MKKRAEANSTRYIFATFDRNVNTYVPFKESQVGNTRSTIIANDISLHNLAVSGIVSAFRASSVKEVGWEPLTLLSISMSDGIRMREYLGLLITILHSGVLMDGNLRAVPILWHVPYSPDAGWLQKKITSLFSVRRKIQNSLRLLPKVPCETLMSLATPFKNQGVKNFTLEAQAHLA